MLRRIEIDLTQPLLDQVGYIQTMVAFAHAADQNAVKKSRLRLQAKKVAADKAIIINDSEIKALMKRLAIDEYYEAGSRAPKYTIEDVTKKPKTQSDVFTRNKGWFSFGVGMSALAGGGLGAYLLVGFAASWLGGPVGALAYAIAVGVGAAAFFAVSAITAGIIYLVKSKNEQAQLDQQQSDTSKAESFVGSVIEMSPRIVEIDRQVTDEIAKINAKVKSFHDKIDDVAAHFKDVLIDGEKDVLDAEGKVKQGFLSRWKAQTPILPDANQKLNIIHIEATHHCRMGESVPKFDVNVADRIASSSWETKELVEGSFDTALDEVKRQCAQRFISQKFSPLVKEINENVDLSGAKSKQWLLTGIQEARDMLSDPAKIKLKSCADIIKMVDAAFELAQQAYKQVHAQQIAKAEVKVDVRAKAAKLAGAVPPAPVAVPPAANVTTDVARKSVFAVEGAKKAPHAVCRTPFFQEPDLIHDIKTEDMAASAFGQASKTAQKYR